MAHTHLAGQLEIQANERLRGYAKSHGMSIVEHLILAGGQLQLLAPALAGGVLDFSEAPFEAPSREREYSPNYFEQLGLYSQGHYQTPAMIDPG